MIPHPVPQIFDVPCLPTLRYDKLFCSPVCFKASAQRGHFEGGDSARRLLLSGSLYAPTRGRMPGLQIICRYNANCSTIAPALPEGCVRRRIILCAADDGQPAEALASKIGTPSRSTIVPARCAGSAPQIGRGDYPLFPARASAKPAGAPLFITFGQRQHCPLAERLTGQIKL